MAKAEKTAISHGLNDLICMIAFARGVIWLGAGRPAVALEHLTRVFDRNDPAFHEAARFMSISYLADAAAQSGQRQVAAAILEELETLAQRTPSPTLHGGLEYARAVLAPDSGAERLYDMALRSDLRHHASTMPGCSSPTEPGSAAGGASPSRARRFGPRDRYSTP